MRLNVILTLQNGLEYSGIDDLMLCLVMVLLGLTSTIVAHDFSFHLVFEISRPVHLARVCLVGSSLSSWLGGSI